MAILETSFRKTTSYDRNLSLGIYPTYYHELVNQSEHLLTKILLDTKICLLCQEY